MPICERDPWRQQFFANVFCPPGLDVPVDDIDCWPWMPRHRWVYDRLKVAESQGIKCAPHGVMPDQFPVFSKPIVNLRGMGIGSTAIHSPSEMMELQSTGHMWMELLEGEHLSTDCAVVEGNIKWMRHAAGIPSGGGMFNYWTIHAEANQDVAGYIVAWVAKHLPDYTGMLNVETIGGRISEMHLRFSDQWPDLYGQGWVEALVGLYADRCWNFREPKKITGYSIPLFARNGQSLRHPSASMQSRILSLPSVSSLQITFREHVAEKSHAMPPGGFRVGIINCLDLTAGLAARRELAAGFPGVEFMIPE